MGLRKIEDDETGFAFHSRCDNFRRGLRAPFPGSVNSLLPFNWRRLTARTILIRKVIPFRSFLLALLKTGPLTQSLPDEHELTLKPARLCGYSNPLGRASCRNRPSPRRPSGFAMRNLIDSPPTIKQMTSCTRHVSLLLRRGRQTHYKNANMLKQFAVDPTLPFPPCIQS